MERYKLSVLYHPSNEGRASESQREKHETVPVPKRIRLPDGGGYAMRVQKMLIKSDEESRQAVHLVGPSIYSIFR